jgi:hypothetical protein
MAADEVLKRLASRPDQGLDSAEASHRLQQHGSNLLPMGKKQSAFMRFLLQFNNVLVYVLIGAGLLKFALGLWLDASIILGVVFLNSLLGFIQEGKAAEALESISKMLSAEARALRDGEDEVARSVLNRVWAQQPSGATAAVAARLDDLLAGREATAATELALRTRLLPQADGSAVVEVSLEARSTDGVEGYCFAPPQVVRPHVLNQFVRRVLVGGDALQREKLWSELEHWQRGSAGQLTLGAGSRTPGSLSGGNRTPADFGNRTPADFGSRTPGNPRATVST